MHKKNLPITASNNRYAKSLEQAPNLLAALQDHSSQELSLRSEVGVARMLLEQVLETLGGIYAKTQAISPIAAQSASGLLAQVQSMVTSAAAIEAKRDDQKLSAAHVLMLLGNLRDEIKRRLNQAFGETAAQICDDVFTNAKWTGGMNEDSVREALLEPAAFDLRLRIVDREGDALKEAAKSTSISSPELVALIGGADDAKNADPLAVPEFVESELV